MAGADDAQATVGKFMQAMVEERFDDARILLHDEFVVYEAGGVPYSGEYRSPQSFFELFSEMNEELELTPDPRYSISLTVTPLLCATG